VVCHAEPLGITVPHQLRRRLVQHVADLEELPRVGRALGDPYRVGAVGVEQLEHCDPFARWQLELGDERQVVHVDEVQLDAEQLEDEMQ
jgi:hypothetical protein